MQTLVHQPPGRIRSTPSEATPPPLPTSARSTPAAMASSPRGMPWLVRSTLRAATFSVSRVGAAAGAAIGPSAAGDGGNDVDQLAILHRGLLAVEEADVLLADEHVDEAAQLAGIVAQARLDAGVRRLDRVERLVDAGGRDLHGLLATGEVAQDAGNADGHGHDGLLRNRAGMMVRWGG